MELAAQSFPIAIFIATSFGLLSFLSPCVLPIVPPYLAYMSGVSMQEMQEGDQRKHVLLSSIYFVLGLSTVFLILALAVNRIASNFLAYQEIFNIISGVVIIVFGLHFLGVFRIGFLQREMRFSSNATSTSPIGAYTLGLAFAFGWSPCLGPALSAILGLVANQDQLARGMTLMGFYALGLGVPFVLSALLINKFLAEGSKLRQWMPVIEKAMGGLLIAVGILMITGNFSNISFWLLEFFPFLERFG